MANWLLRLFHIARDVAVGLFLMALIVITAVSFLTVFNAVFVGISEWFGYSGKDAAINGMVMTVMIAGLLWIAYMWGNMFLNKVRNRW